MRGAGPSVILPPFWCVNAPAWYGSVPDGLSSVALGVIVGWCRAVTAFDHPPNMCPLVPGQTGNWLPTLPRPPLSLNMWRGRCGRRWPRPEPVNDHSRWPAGSPTPPSAVSWPARCFATSAPLRTSNTLSVGRCGHGRSAFNTPRTGVRDARSRSRSNGAGHVLSIRLSWREAGVISSTRVHSH